MKQKKFKKHMIRILATLSLSLAVCLSAESIKPVYAETDPDTCEHTWTEAGTDPTYIDNKWYGYSTSYDTFDEVTAANGKTFCKTTGSACARYRLDVLSDTTMSIKVATDYPTTASSTYDPKIEVKVINNDEQICYKTISGWDLYGGEKEVTITLKAGTNDICIRGAGKNNYYYAGYYELGTYTYDECSNCHTKAAHDYDTVVNSQATCTTAGSQTNTCKNCGYVETVKIPATGHHIGEHTLYKYSSSLYIGYPEDAYKVDEPELCGDYYRYYYKCDNCNTEWKTSYYLTSDTAYSYGKTKNADHVFETDENGEIKKYNHTPATCTTDGSYETHCTLCNHDIEQYEYSLGHDYSDSITEAATCIMPGYTSNVCSRCQNNEFLECYENVLLRYKSSSSYASYDDYSLAVLATNEMTDYYTGYGTDITMPLNHDWVETDRTDSTCITTGSVSYDCSRCDAQKEEDLELADHDLVRTTLVEPTYESSGSYRYTCNNCDYTYDENITNLSVMTQETIYPSGNYPYDMEFVYVCETTSSDNAYAAIDKDGNIWGWGSNSTIGINTSKPKQLTQGLKFKKVEILSDNMYAIDEHGCIWRNGKKSNNGLYLTNDNSNTGTSTIFEHYDSNVKFKDISVCYGDSSRVLFLSQDGDIYLTGCGNGTTEILNKNATNGYYFMEKVEAGDTKFAKARFVYGGLVAMSTEGDFWSGGTTGSSYLTYYGAANGDHTFQNRNIGFSIKALGNAGGNTFVIDENGDVWGVGQNNYNFLTTEENSSSTATFVKILEGEHAIKVDSEYGMISVLTEDGRLFLKGSGNYYYIPGTSSYNTTGFMDVTGSLGIETKITDTFTNYAGVFFTDEYHDLYSVGNYYYYPKMDGSTSYNCNKPVSRITAITHHFEETGEKMEATCNENGYVDLTCTDCELAFRKTLNALGHDYAYDHDSEQYQGDIKSYSIRCTRCGDTKNASVEDGSVNTAYYTFDKSCTDRALILSETADSNALTATLDGQSFLYTEDECNAMTYPFVATKFKDVFSLYRPSYNYSSYTTFGAGIDYNGDILNGKVSQGTEGDYPSYSYNSNQYFRFHYDNIWFTDVYPYSEYWFSAKDINDEWYIHVDTSSYGRYQMFNIKDFANYESLSTFTDSISGETMNLAGTKIKKVLIRNNWNVEVLYENGICLILNIGYISSSGTYGVTGYVQCPAIITDMDLKYLYAENGNCYSCNGSSFTECDNAYEKTTIANRYITYNKGSAYSYNDFTKAYKTAKVWIENGSAYVSGNPIALNRFVTPTMTNPDKTLLSDGNTYVRIATNGIVDNKGIKYALTDTGRYIETKQGDTSVTLVTKTNNQTGGLQIIPGSHTGMHTAVTKEATCEEYGEIHVTCDDCGLDEIVKTQKLEHDFTYHEVSANVTKSCSVCGATESIPDISYTNVIPNGAAAIGDTTGKYANILLDCQGNAYSFGGGIQTGTNVSASETPTALNWDVKLKTGSIGDVFYGIDFNGNIWRCGALNNLDTEKSAEENEALIQVTSGVTFTDVAANVGNQMALAVDENNNLYISDIYSYYSFEPFDISDKTTTGAIKDIAVVNNTGYIAYENGKVFAVKREYTKKTTSSSYYTVESISVVACPDITQGNFRVVNKELLYTTGTTTKTEQKLSELTSGSVTKTTIFTYDTTYASEKMLVNFNTSTGNAVLSLKDGHLYGYASSNTLLNNTFPASSIEKENGWILIDEEQEYTDIFTAAGVFFAVRTNGDIVSMGESAYSAMAGRDIAENTLDTVSILSIHNNHLEVEEFVDYTCTTDGYTKYVCNACGIRFIADRTSAAHKWELVETLEEATFGHFGRGVYECSVCGERKEDTTEQTDTIDASEWEYTTDDTNNIINLTKYRGTKNTVRVNSYYYVLAKDKWYHTQLGVSNYSYGNSTGPFIGSTTTIRAITIGSDVTVEGGKADDMFAYLNLSELQGFPKNVTSANRLFYGATLPSMDLSNGELSQATKVDNIFRNAKFADVKIKFNKDITAFNAIFNGAKGNGVEMMFEDDSLSASEFSAAFSESNIKKITADMSNTKLVRANYLFYGSAGTTEFHVKFPQTAKQMSATFENCTSITAGGLDITYPDEVDDMSLCFAGCTSLVTAPTNLPLAYNCRQIFYDCTSLEELADLHDTYESRANGKRTFTSAYENCAIKNLDYKFCMIKNNDADYRNMFRSVYPESIRLGYQAPSQSGYEYWDIAESFSKIVLSQNGSMIGKEVTQDNYTSVVEYYPCDVSFYCSVPAQALCLFSNSEITNVGNYTSVLNPKTYPNHPAELGTHDATEWENFNDYIDIHQYDTNGICTECHSYEHDNMDITNFTYTTENNEMIISAYGGLDTTLSIPDTYTIDDTEYQVVLTDNFNYGYYVTDLTLGRHIKLQPTANGSLHFNLEYSLCNVNRIPVPKNNQSMEVVRKNKAFQSQNLVLPDQCQTVRLGYRKAAYLQSNGDLTYSCTVSESKSTVLQSHPIHLLYGCGNPYVLTDGSSQTPFVTGDGLLNDVNITNAKYTLEKTHLDADEDNFCDGCGNFLGSEEFPFEFSVATAEDGLKKGTLVAYMGEQFEQVDDSNIHIPSSITINGETYQICIDTSVYLFMDKTLDTVVIDAGVEWNYETSPVTFNGIAILPQEFGGNILQKSYETQDRHNNIFYHSTGLRSLTIGASNMTNFNGFFAPGIGYNDAHTQYTSLDAGEYENLVELNLPDNTDSIVDLFTSRGYVIKNGEGKNCFATTNTNLQTLTLPDSITDMYGALANVNTLRTVNIPQNATDMRLAYAYTNVQEFISNIPTSATNLDWAFAYAQTTDYSFANTLSENTNLTTLTATFIQSKITQTVPLPPNVTDIAMMYYGSSLQGDVEFTSAKLQNVKLSVADTAITGYKLTVTGSQEVIFTPETEMARGVNDTITTDNTGMFYRCPNLTTVDITIPNIKNGVLGWMENKKIRRFYFAIDNLTELNYTFEGWNQLEEVSDIPYGVTSMIGTFKNSGLLSFPNIPETVTDMSYCFQGTYITEIPSNVLTEGVQVMEGTFRDCDKLETVTNLPNSVTNLQQAFEHCDRLVSVGNLPDSCNNLDGTFFACAKLETVGTLPDGILELRDTFLNCTSLTTVGNVPGAVTFPDSVVTIGRAFQNTAIQKVENWSENLVSLNGTARIMDYDGEYVPSRERVAGTIYTCGEIYHTAASTECLADEYRQAAADYQYAVAHNLSTKEELLEKLRYLTYAEKLCGSHYPTGAFQNSKLESIPDFPESLLFMEGAFESCTELTQAPAMHKNIENAKNAFKLCSSLTSAKKIAGKNLENAFAGCSSLSEIQAYDVSETTNMNGTFALTTALTQGIPIGAKVSANAEGTYKLSGITALPEIENGVTALVSTFAYCENIGDESNTTIPESVTNFEKTFTHSSITKAPVTYGGSYTQTFADCTALTDASKTMQGDVTAVSETFKNCQNLTLAPLDIHFTGTYIDGLYADCSNLLHGSNIRSTTLQYADRIYKNCEKMQDASFEGCSAIESLNETFYNCESLTSVELDGLTSVQTMYGTFYNCKKLEVAPSLENCSNLKTMNATFYNCESLSELPELPDSIETMNNSYSYLAYTHTAQAHDADTDCNCDNRASGGTFENCIGLTEIETLPSSLKTLNTTFKGCTNLMYVTAFPDELFVISNAFENCEKLTEIGNLPDTVTYAKRAFYNTNIEEIYISSALTVEQLSEAFKNCPNLQKVTFADATVATGELSDIFGIEKSLADRLFDDNIKGFKLTTVLNENNVATNNSVLTPERWMSSFRRIAGVYSSNMNENGTIVFNEGDQAQIKLRLKGQDLNPVWFKANTTINLDDVNVVYTPSDYANNTEAQITFQSDKFDEYVANKGTTTASYVILFDVTFNEAARDEYALVNVANANSLVSVYDTSTNAFNHIFQDDSDFGALQMAKKSNKDTLNPTDLTAEEMENAVQISNFRLCEININDSSKVLRPENTKYEEADSASVFSTLRTGFLSLLGAEGNTADVTDMMSTLTLSNLSAEDDGSVYVCYLEAYSSGLRTLLQPVTLNVNEIESITAEYKGDPIWVGETQEYDKDDVEVIATYTDGSKVTLTSDEWSEDSLLVQTKGLNTYTATAGTASAQFKVPGVVYGKLEPDYLGNPILIGNNYNKVDVEVVLYEFDADSNYYEDKSSGTILTSEQWEADSLTVTNLENVYTASYEDDYVFMYDLSLVVDPDTGDVSFGGSGDIIYGITKGDYGVPGYKEIKKITAEYIGDPILITDNYNKQDVIVTIIYADDTTEEVSQYFWRESSLIVDKKGLNDYTATYYDKGSMQNYTADYQVPGIVQASITATYKGEPVRINQDYDKDDVEVILTQTRADDTKYVDDITLSANDWTESGLTVTQIGENTFTATYTDTYIVNGSAEDDYIVPGYLKAIGLDAEYKGEPILIVDDYDKDDVEVIVTFEDNSTKTLTSDEWEESGLTVTDKGLNSFMATYTDEGGEQVSDTYDIPGLVKATISAEYTGEPVRVSEDYHKDDVLVVLSQETADGSSYTEDITLSSNDWIESGLTVTQKGDNTFTATYEDNYIVNGSAEDDYIVPGYYKAIAISAEYKGEPIPIVDDYDKDDVEVIVTFEDNSTKTLSSDEWEESSLSVTEKGINTFTATYQELSDTYDIAGLVYADLQADYKGIDIEVNYEYDKDDVEVILYYLDKDGNVLNTDGTQIASDEWQESGLTVTQEGNNTFTATYEETYVIGVITDNYIVNGYIPDPNLLSIEAVYNGPDIYINSNYDKSDVTVTAYYDDNTSRVLEDDEWNENDLTVSLVGINTFVASYKGMTDDYDVIGLDYVDHIEAEYTGDPVFVGEEYDKDDVLVEKVYASGDREPIPSEDWEESGLIVEKVGENDYTATYEDYEPAEYTIPGIDEAVSLTAEYNGPDIYVGNKYQKKDVEVVVYYRSGDTKVLSSDEWNANTLMVSTVGTNEYTATYQNLSAPYSVIGFEESSIEADYHGPDVPIGNPYEKKDVTVVVTYTNDTTKTLETQDWQESGLTVEKAGDNTFTATYKDLTDDYRVPGIDSIKNLTATYTGPSIKIGSEYKKDDVVVTLHFISGATKKLTTDEWKESSLVVQKKGINIFQASYNNMEAPYNVLGVDYVTDLKAEYKGEKVYVGEEYKKEDVTVTVTYATGKEKELTPEEWQESGLTVEKSGDNEYTATFEETTAEYKVPGYEIDHIEAIYEGEPVRITENYKKDDVKVSIIYTDDTSKVLTTDEWKESSLKVEKVGENEYTATYQTYTDTYKVVGFDDTITLKSISGTYPEYVLVGEKYVPEKANITLTYSDGSTQALAYSKLTVTPSDITVKKVGNNEYEIGYQEAKGILVVPGYEIDHITATYKGPDIVVNHDYDKAKVEVTIYYTNDTTATTTDFTVDSTRVTKVDENNYTATYKNHTADFVVIGLPEEEKTTIVPTETTSTPTQTVVTYYVPTADHIVSRIIILLSILIGSVTTILIYRRYQKKKQS